jgi:TonB-dependent receptor
MANKNYLPIKASLALLLGFSISLNAASFDGTVSDSMSGSALEGASVTIPALDLETTTNRRGYFQFDGIEPGSYAVQVEYIGAQSKTVEASVTEGESEMLALGLNLNVYELTDFSVSSYQSATARALNMQRSSENLKDIVASDQFGQFADSNAAEALNRLPGVSVERDQGEGRFVVIRGINPDLNSVALDGVTLASPSADQRSTLLDTIPIEVLNTLEVTKAVTPDQPGDSIGGYINLRSPSAFDYEGRTTRLSGALLYSDLVDETGHRFNAFFADTFGKEDQWGLVLTAVNSERTFGSDNVEATPWEEEGAGFVTEEIEFREYDLTRERSGITANLEFQPNQDSLFFLRTSYNNYQDVETRDLSKAAFEGDPTNVTASSFGHLSVEDDPGEFVGVASEIEVKDREENMRIFVASIGGEQTFDQWSLNYTLAFSQAEEDTPYDQEAIYAAPAPSGAGLGGTTLVTGTNGYKPRLLAPGAVPGGLSGPDYSDPAIYELDEFVFGEQKATETDLSGKFDLKREFDHERLAYIKFGGLVRNKDKENDADESTFDATDPGFANFLQGSRRNFLNRPTPSLSTGILDFADANYVFDPDLEASVVEDYDTTENVLAAYFMGSLNFGEWDVIVGARMEHTEFETEGFAFDADTDVVTQTSFDKDYTNLLPGVHIRRDVGEDGVFRASWTNTIARPTFEQSRPGVLVDGDEIERGNPDLDPYEAMNLDASFQYYSEDYGVFGIAVFYKDIENFIYEQVSDETIGGTDFEVTDFNNGDDGEILGLELSYSKQFTSLPGVLSGLSLSSNLTLTDSEANATRAGGDDAKVSFLKQSDVIGNVSLAWEWDRYFLRISGTYRDDYLDELGEDSDGFEDRYVDDFFQVDLYSSVQIYKGLSIFAEVNNLTNEPFRAYWGGSNRVSQFEEYGVSGAIGAKWSF